MHDLPPVFMAVAAGSIALALALGWWYRQGDRKVQRRVTNAAEKPFVLPEPEPIPLAMPVAPSQHEADTQENRFRGR
jgi:hypothetical protein